MRVTTTTLIRHNNNKQRDHKRERKQLKARETINTRTEITTSYALRSLFQNPKNREIRPNTPISTTVAGSAAVSTTFTATSTTAAVGFINWPGRFAGILIGRPAGRGDAEPMTGEAGATTRAILARLVVVAGVARRLGGEVGRSFGAARGERGGTTVVVIRDRDNEVGGIDFVAGNLEREGRGLITRAGVESSSSPSSFFSSSISCAVRFCLFFGEAETTTTG